MPGPSDDTVFERLPKFDPSEFEPPAWANGPAFDFTRKNGESSKSGQGPSVRDATKSQDRSRHDIDTSDDGTRDDDDLSDDEEEVWEDARSGLEETVEATDEGLAFTLPGMKASPPHLASLMRGLN